jgi:hypothetical protein
VQVFAFYREQFHAVTGLAVSLVIWIVLRAMARREALRLREPGDLRLSTGPGSR